MKSGPRDIDAMSLLAVGKFFYYSCLFSFTFFLVTTATPAAAVASPPPTSSAADAHQPLGPQWRRKGYAMTMGTSWKYSYPLRCIITLPLSILTEYTCPFELFSASFLLRAFAWTFWAYQLLATIFFILKWTESGCFLVDYCWECIWLAVA